MKSYQIVSAPDINWNLFTNEYSGFCQEIGAEVASVLSGVCRAFVDTFGPAAVRAHPTLAVVYAEDGPVTFRENCLIFLSSRGKYYLQHMYQFAHELCHFMVPSGVCQEYRWLEETLCQMMSWYALQKILDSRDTAPINALRGEYGNLPKYLANSMSDRYPIAPDQLPELLPTWLPHLRDTCYDRRLNRTIASGIYPLFLAAPQLWQIVPALCRLTPEMDLASALGFLCGDAQIPDDLRRQLALRLCQ